mmetsp:Transcript_10074/g.33063  ORF Transcript_10074/g.33063 Transcript_10074/m.33063 type:complete len:232 (-) Transcript_10074:8-703(-)
MEANVSRADVQANRGHAPHRALPSQERRSKWRERFGITLKWVHDGHAAVGRSCLSGGPSVARERARRAAHHLHRGHDVQRILEVFWFGTARSGAHHLSRGGAHDGEAPQLVLLLLVQDGEDNFAPLKTRLEHEHNGCVGTDDGVETDDESSRQLGDAAQLRQAEVHHVRRAEEGDFAEPSVAQLHKGAQVHPHLGQLDDQALFRGERDGEEGENEGTGERVGGWIYDKIKK